MSGIEVFDSIEKFSPAEWDALGSDAPTARHAWFALLEQTWRYPLRRHYFALQEGGRLCAAAVCTELDFAPGAPGPRRACEWLRHIGARLGLAVLPALLVGPIGWRSPHLIASPDLDAAERGEAFAQLLGAIERFGRERGLPLALRAVGTDQPELLAALDARGFRRMPGEPLAYLDIEWSHFDDYVRARGRHGGRNLRRELRLCRSAQLELRPIAEPAAVAGRLFELAQTHYARLNGRPFPHHPTLFERAARSFGEDLLLAGLYERDALIGFSLRLGRTPDSQTVHLGMDSAHARKHGAFFLLAFYGPIADAIAMGTKRIYYGSLNYQAKVARGCKLLDTSFCYRAHGIRALLTAPILAWEQRKTRAAPDPAQATEP